MVGCPANWLASSNLLQVQEILQALCDYPWLSGPGSVKVTVTELPDSKLSQVPPRVPRRGRPRRNQPPATEQGKVLVS